MPNVRRSTVRWVALGAVAVLLATACQPTTRYVYIDEAASAGHGSYTPIARSADPRVDLDRYHPAAPAVAIGPEASGQPLAPILPIATSGSPLVSTGPARRPWKPFQFSFEQAGDAAPSVSNAPTPDTRADLRLSSPTPVARGSYWTSAAVGANVPRPTAVPPTPVPPTATPQPTAPRAVANATMPARYNLGTNLGTPVAANGPSLSMAVGGEEQRTISGTIEQVLDHQVVIRTASGSQTARLPDTARLERENGGQLADLRPGAIVGVTARPSGPASAVRLYAAGPGMPRPGITPLDGPQLGQVAVYGQIVSLQGGSVVVNSGTETTPISLPSGVPVLKPAPASLADLKVGASLTATGSLGADGTLTAVCVRLTSVPAPAH